MNGIALWAPLLLVILGFFTLIGGLVKLIFMAGKTHSRLEALEKQFKPNGGSSLKDDINAVKGEVRDISVKFTAHLSQHDGVWR